MADRRAEVLILVLMEDTLRDKLICISVIWRCLNPCFNGRYSTRLCKRRRKAETFRQVLILVLMEDTLREH